MNTNIRKFKSRVKAETTEVRSYANAAFSISLIGGMGVLTWGLVALATSVIKGIAGRGRRKNRNDRMNWKIWCLI